MKIKAKVMFKRSGYEKENTHSERFIAYKNPIISSYIQFDLKNKTYISYRIGFEGKMQPRIISIKEMLAIQKQIEELGWLEER